jgi:hypothetical protein
MRSLTCLPNAANRQSVHKITSGALTAASTITHHASRGRWPEAGLARFLSKEGPPSCRYAWSPQWLSSA